MRQSIEDAQANADANNRKAATKIQSMFRVHLARKQLQCLVANVVEKCYDADSGLFYYFNHQTGQSSWVKPKALGQADLTVTLYEEKATRFFSKSVEDQAEEMEISQPKPMHYEEYAKEHVTDEKNSLHAQRTTSEEKMDPKEEKRKLENKDSKSKQLEVDANDADAEKDDHDKNEADDEADDEDDDEKDSEKKNNGKDDDEPDAFTEEELNIIREQFNAYDLDGSGSINPTELQRLLTAFGEKITLKKVMAMIKEVDANGNGEVELEEFIEILRKKRAFSTHSSSLQLAMMFGPSEMEKLKLMFKSIDSDGSGAIDESELQTMIRSLGYKIQDFNVKALIAEVDKDKNGVIDFNEFVNIVYNMRQHEKTGFAKLLNDGLTQGLFRDLAEVLSSTTKKVADWWNKNEVARQKALRRRMEKSREAELHQKLMSVRDRELYEEAKRIQEKEEKKRTQYVEGLLHEVEFEGDGVNYPMKNEYCRVHYTGFFEDGTVFESSRKRGTAFEFKLGSGHVIEGWEISLLRMSVGETAKISCAPKLAYGIKGRMPKIPPNTTLFFRIELIAIHQKVEKRDFGEEVDSDF